MSYQQRDNGTHAILCDTDACHIELLAPSKDDVYSDANLAGWVSAGKDSDTGEDLHTCSHCSRGTHPGASLIKRMLGGDTFDTEAPCGVLKGEEVRDDDGNLIGHYEADATQGEVVKVKLKFPEPEAPTSASSRYAEMMEGADDDDDASGLRSVVAPGGAVGSQAAPQAAAPLDPPPKPRSLHTAPGSDGGDGIVQPAPAPDSTSAEAQAAMSRAPAAPRGPQLDTAASDDAMAAFDGIGSWDPDDDD